ncbi:MAG: hypothetical protein HKM06_09370 [Spirochaetales bacterium]|nr:hypothetical protein [Spirochaetales bacterium]
MKNLLFALLAFLLVAACATQPPHPEMPTYAAGYLAEGASVVGKISLTASPELKKKLDEHASLRDVVDRTRDLWFSFSLKGLKPAGWRLVLMGDFPKGLVGWALDGKPGWKKQNEPGPQWRDVKAGVSVALPEDGVVLASAQSFEPNDLVWNARLARELPSAVLQKTDLFVDIQSPSGVLFGEAGSRLIPIQELRLALQATSDGWEGPIVLILPNEQAARTTRFLLKIWAASVASQAPPAQGSLQAQLSQLVWTVRGSTLVADHFVFKNSTLLGLVDKLLEGKKSPKAEP